jgi:hypothetical protein
VVWAMELVAESEEVQSFFAQVEKKHHETYPQCTPRFSSCVAQG